MDRNDKKSLRTYKRCEDFKTNGGNHISFQKSYFNRTDTEIDSLRNAISNEFLNHQGWTTDNYGRVKENSIQIYKAGYITAIQKILNEI